MLSIVVDAQSETMYSFSQIEKYRTVVSSALLFFLFIVTLYLFSQQNLSVSTFKDEFLPHLEHSILSLNILRLIKN